MQLGELIPYRRWRIPYRFADSIQSEGLMPYHLCEMDSIQPAADLMLVFIIPRYRSGEIPSSLMLLGFARFSLAKLRQAQDDREGYSLVS